MATRKNNKTTNSNNQSATIRTRSTSNGKLRTETYRRDRGSMRAAVSTCPKTDATQLFVDFPDRTIRLDGRQARTLYRILQKHYQMTNKSF